MKTRIMMFALFIGLVSCDNDNNESKKPLPEPINIQLSQVEKQIANSERINAMKLFSLVTEKEGQSIAAVALPQKENFMFSPYSLNIALSMTWNAAKGETKEGIEKALGYEPNYGEAVNAYQKKIATALVKTDPSTKLSIANSIWYRQTAKLKATFEEIGKKWYDAEVNGVDFLDANTKNLMNRWCENKTNGLIKKVIERTSKEDMMYLMNALYFKGVWAEDFEFKKTDTKQEDFTLENSTKVKVPMMYQKSLMNYTEDEVFSAVSLPYGNGAYSMVILLPKENKTFSEMITHLKQSDVLSDKLNMHKKAEVSLYLPKFKFEYNIVLNDILKTLGMDKAFANDADFSNAFEAESLKVSEVKQFTYIEVNEKGTEAAAVTTVGFVGTSAPVVQKEIIFRADKPFAFFIQENSAGAILFMGKVGNPNKE